MFSSTSQVIYPSFEEAEVKLLEKKPVEVDENSKKFFPKKKKKTGVGNLKQRCHTQAK